MTNKKQEQNNCAGLHDSKMYAHAQQKYRELKSSGIDPFEHMLQMQYDLQNDMARKKPDLFLRPDELKTIGQKFDWLRENKQAFDDEYREILDALPGIDRPTKDRSALWKRWKAKYHDIRSLTFDDLSPDELKELKYELTDSFHFYMNFFFALDMDAEEMFVYYYLKNAENLRRIRDGY